MDQGRGYLGRNDDRPASLPSGKHSRRALRRRGLSEVCSSGSASQEHQAGAQGRLSREGESSGHGTVGILEERNTHSQANASRLGATLAAFAIRQRPLRGDRTGGYVPPSQVAFLPRVAWAGDGGRVPRPQLAIRYPTFRRCSSVCRMADRNPGFAGNHSLANGYCALAEGKERNA